MLQLKAPWLLTTCSPAAAQSAHGTIQKLEHWCQRVHGEGLSMAVLFTGLEANATCH